MSKELRPPQELVDAIQASGDMTAPASAEAASDITGSNVPRSIRNRLEHEEPRKMTDEQRARLEERAAGGDHSTFLADPQARKDHMAEVRAEQEAAMQYDRSHPGAGHGGQGDQAIHSMTNLKANEKVHTSKGPHFKDHYAQSKS